MVLGLSTSHSEYSFQFPLLSSFAPVHTALICSSIAKMVHELESNTVPSSGKVSLTYTDISVVLGLNPRNPNVFLSPVDTALICSTIGKVVHGLESHGARISLQIIDYILTYTNMHFNSHSLRSGIGFRSPLVEKENMLVTRK